MTTGPSLPADLAKRDAAGAYARHRRDHLLDVRRKRADQTALLGALSYRPVFQVVVDRDSALPDAEAAIALFDSLQAQIDPDWTALVVSRGQPASPDLADAIAHYAQAMPQLAPDVVETDSRTLHRLLAEREGGWVVLIDRPGRLAPDALLRLALAIDEFHQAGVVYGDEDHMRGPGWHADPLLKTPWDPAFGLTRDLFGGLKAIAAGVAVRCGGAVTHGPAWFYDMALRATEQLEMVQVRHVPQVLFHRLAEPSAAARWPAEAAAAADAVTRRGLAATVQPAGDGVRRLVPKIAEAPLVSVIIPTRDRLDLLRTAVTGVLERTDYPAIELIVVDNGSEAPETLAYLAELDRRSDARVLRIDAPFNFSTLNNSAAAAARGELLLFLNNDIEVVDQGWLREMVAHALRREVGAVGSLLLYPDGTVQHAGVAIGVDGEVARHVGLRERPEAVETLLGATERPVSAVTAACMAIRRELFLALGGFDPALSVAYNDVDMCLRLGRAGYRVVWTPAARLVHHESASRSSDRSLSNRDRALLEERFMRDRWGLRLRDEPWHPYGVSLNPSRWRGDEYIQDAVAWLR
jgi:GT2 family glycosyltransferase